MRNMRRKIGVLLISMLCILLFVPGAAQAKVTLGQKKTTIYIGKARQMKLSGTKKKVTWKSSKPKVVAVSSNGIIVAKKAGTATISATAGKKTYTCKVTVKAALSASKKELTIKKGKKKTVTIKLAPVFSKTDSIRYVISDKRIMTGSFGSWNKEGNAIGLTITAKKRGKATVTIKSTYSSETLTINVRVK